MKKNNEDNIGERIFGRIPEKPRHLYFRKVEIRKNFPIHNVSCNTLLAEMEFEDNRIDFPVQATIPDGDTRSVIICFCSKNSIRYDEILTKSMQNGIALFTVDCDYFESNNKDFKKRLTKQIVGSRRKRSSAGNIAILTYIAVRVKEIALAMPEIGIKPIGIFGEGVFGLSALLSSMIDDDFSFVIAEDLPKFDHETALKSPLLFSPAYLILDQSKADFDAKEFLNLSKEKLITSEDILNDKSRETIRF